METRSQRAWRDTKPWFLSRKDIVYSIFAAPLVFVVQLVFGKRASLSALGLAVLAILAAFFLIPAGVYVGSWATAVSRIHRDEFGKLRKEIGDLKATFVKQKESSELLERLKELKMLADILNRRLPPLAPPSEPLEQELEDWADLASDALVDLPEMREQFVAATTENSLLTAFKACPTSIRFQIRTGILSTIIKFVVDRDGPKT